MFFQMNATNVGSTVSSFNAHESYRIYLVLSNDQPINSSVAPLVGLVPGQVIAQGFTIPVPADANLESVSLIPSTPIAIGSAPNPNVSPMDSSTWSSTMTSSSGFQLMQWGGAQTPYTSSSGTTFDSWQANANNNYWSGDQWITSPSLGYILNGPDDGFTATMEVYNYIVNPSTPAMEEVAFVSDACPATNSDSEYGFIFNNQFSNSVYSVYSQQNGAFYWDQINWGVPLVSQYNSFGVTLLGSGGSLFPAFIFDGDYVLFGNGLTLNSPDCFTIGWNSQNQTSTPRNNPFFSLSSNYVELTYG